MRSELLAKIQICYERVKIWGVFDAGFCFGLLDPLSNIIVNTFISMTILTEDDQTKDDSSGKASFPGTRGDRKVSFPGHGQTDLIGDMKQRSLNGLLAFLAVLFPHLTDAQAVWYLYKANADPLVAARIIIKHRRMDQSFRFASDTTVAAVETALRCAAAAAQHPNPKQFLIGWKILSPCLKKLAPLLSAPGVTSDFFKSIPIMESLLEKPRPPVVELNESWDLASSRFVSLSPDLEGVVFPGRATVKRLLLTTIHGYYLQALARLPRDELRSHYAYSMLQAGHCYGPLDPVSNIILNTIWYSAAYPLRKEHKENFAVDMISTSGLLRIAVRSFYGLVSVLCTRYATLTVDRAMLDLLEAGANLRIADPNLRVAPGNHSGRIPSASVEEAYAAAAAAVLHPKPDDQVELLRPSTLILRMASDYLKGSGQLSREAVDRLSSVSWYSSLRFKHQLLSETKVVDKWTYTRVNQQRNNFWNKHARVVRMVKSAIDMYNSQLGVPKYELHIICGVNEYVHGPEYITCDNQIYHHSISTSSPHAKEAPPVLFFAQWSNDGTKECLCCPVCVPPSNSEQVRCLYCEYEGSRIVHPAKESFHGRDIEFEKMLCGGLYPGNYTNNYIIEHSCPLAFWVNGLEDDSIYTVSRMDDREDEALSSEKRFHRLIELS